MIDFLRRAIKTLPTLLTAFLLALVLWIYAVTSTDPTESGTFGTPIPIEIIGQDPALIRMGELPTTLTLKLSAPRSIWGDLNNQPSLIRAIVDLSGLEAGTHVLPVQVQIGARPAQIESYTPATVEITLENLMTRTLPVNLAIQGEPAVGYQAETPALSNDSVTITGPEALVNQVDQVQAVLDVNLLQQSIVRTIPLKAVDATQSPVTGITLSPSEITVTQEITQRFGYRSVVVNVVVSGQVAQGYRLTNISVFPPAVTVFSADPSIVDSLPGYVQTEALDLTNATDDLDMFLDLSLPDGLSVVGGQETVLVRVGIAAIESSAAYSNMTVEVVGLSSTLKAAIAPEQVTVIVAGPLPMLDQLTIDGIRVMVDVTGLTAGTYQLTPNVEIAIQNLRVESILPETVEVVISSALSPTPTPRKR
ncbi:MAG TPA: CdaR family protein [Anaerolineaceae bacterium]|nr:CdaR family protein [Anaerolineaceae bacterium]